MSTIILEGPDGAGKSTLAEHLLRGLCLGWTREHHGLYPKDTGEQLLHRYTTSILKGRVLLDRCFMSEFAYGTVMRGQDRLGPQGHRLLSRLCASRGVTEVICLPSFDEVRKNWLEKRKEKFDPVKGTGDYIDAESKLHRVYHLYEMMTANQDRVVQINYQVLPLKEQGFHIVTKMYLQKTLPGYCLGSPMARYLIVGEQANRKRSDFDLPFYQLTGTSLYLNECLRDARAKEFDLAFVNAVKWSGVVTDKHRHRRRHEGENNLKAVVDRLPRFATAIALGEVAARVCQNQGIPYVKLPHPSYWKRFHFNKTKKYIKMLKEVIA